MTASLQTPATLGSPFGGSFRQVYQGKAVVWRRGVVADSVGRQWVKVGTMRWRVDRER